jgi:hypothetical protein
VRRVAPSARQHVSGEDPFPLGLEPGVVADEGGEPVGAARQGPLADEAAPAVPGPLQVDPSGVRLGEEEEALEALGEPWRRGYEMPCAGLAAADGLSNAVLVVAGGIGATMVVALPLGSAPRRLPRRPPCPPARSGRAAAD